MMNNRTENQMNQGMGASSWRMAWLGVWALAAGLLGLAQPALAANPPVVQTFYVPLPENQLLSMMQTINSGTNGNSTSPITSNISISPIGNNTIVYYDHWEDGYEADITNPTQTTSQIWGDGKIANGAAPGVTTDAGDVINAGGLIILKNDVATTTSAVTVTTPTYQFNGRDKIAASKNIAVSRVNWAAGSLTNMTQSTIVYDTANWGLTYRSPIGTNATNSYAMFEYATFAIMAGKGGATINVDTNNDGTNDFTQTLSEGQSYVTPTSNYLTVGARVTSDKPVQVNLLTGDINDSQYKESRDAGLLPVSLWSSDYYTPVSSQNGGTASDTTRVWLYNPGASSITVAHRNRGTGGTGAIASTNVTVNAGSVTAVTVPRGSAARFSSTSSFYAYSTTDSIETTTTNGNQANSSFDWGFPLNPANTLTSQFLVGWAKGKNPNDAAATENSAPVWATVTGNGETPVWVYVDLKADGLGALTDPRGNKYDRRYQLKELQQAKIYDNTTPAASQDQSGMLVYVLPGVGELNEPVTPAATRISGAWGEDPQTATLASPGIDAGTGMVPAPLFDVGKTPSVAIDADGDGKVSPGDTIEYEVRVNNTGRAPITNLKLVDNLPSDTTYVPGTTRYSVGSAASSAIPDGAGGTFPLAGAGYTFASDSIPVGGYLTTWFRVQIKPLATISNISQLVNTVTASANGYDQQGVSNAVLIEAVNDSYTGIINLPVYGNAGNRDTYPPGATFTQLTSPSSAR